MRLPRFRYSVRLLLALVALSAGLVWSTMMLLRSLDYQKRAKECARREVVNRQMIRENLDMSRRRQSYLKALRATDGNGAESKRIADELEELCKLAILHDIDANHYEQLAGKYRWAMWHPWSTVASDPREPSEPYWRAYGRGEGLFAPEPPKFPGPPPPPPHPLHLE